HFVCCETEHDLLRPGFQPTKHDWAIHPHSYSTTAVSKLLFAIACLAAGAAVVALAQIDDEPAPTPVPFTAEPRQSQWRIGFDLGNALVLEAPELNPENEIPSAVREADRTLPRPGLDVGLGLLPASKVSFKNDRLVNPRQWTILDLHSKTSRKSF